MKQALLSFDQTPPIDAPLRFFLTAPLFAMLAGGVLLYSGPAALASRWTPAALALTHLLTAGFLLQVMLGALQQLLPVVAGANMARARGVARVVHASITPGALLLAAAFLSYQRWLFAAAALLLGSGILIFVAAAAHALAGVPANRPVIRSLALALLGLSVTTGLGLLLVVALAWPLPLALVQLTNLHLAWGLLAWGGTLLAGVALVVVPMFQMTPDYPGWFTRGFGPVVLGFVALWSATSLAGWTGISSVLATALVLTAVVLALTTLQLQQRSKRARADAVARLWQFAMLCTLAACALWLAAQELAPLAAWQGWPWLFGTLLLAGGFMSVVLGMLYKIVPFLVWLHLQNLGRGRLVAPNMKKVLAEKAINHQALAHVTSVILLLLACVWPQWLVYPAALGLVLANGWLLLNLLLGLAVYRQHVARLAAMPAPA